MGGYGSGFPIGGSSKATVDESKIEDVKQSLKESDYNV